MERLTDKKEADAQRQTYEKRLKNGYPRNIPEERFLKLAAYEDTGLEPEEITAIKIELMGRETAKITEFDGIPIQRLQELAQAEKDGRLVVMPVNPYLKPTQQNEMYICENGEVWAIYVTGCEVGPNSDGVLAIVYNTVDGDVFSGDDIGKTVFLAREEAEAALKKMEAENEAD